MNSGLQHGYRLSFLCMEKVGTCPYDWLAKRGELDIQDGMKVDAMEQNLDFEERQSMTAEQCRAEEIQYGKYRIKFTSTPCLFPRLRENLYCSAAGVINMISHQKH